VAICEATTFDKICSPERTTAAPVSSQDVSMPRMCTSGIMMAVFVARAKFLTTGSTEDTGKHRELLLHLAIKSDDQKVTVKMLRSIIPKALSPVFPCVPPCSLW